MKGTLRRDQRIIEEAAAWATLLDDGDISAGDRERVAAWLRESPKHVKELLLATAILTDANAIDPERAISIDDLLVDQGADVVSIRPASVTPTTTVPSPRRARFIGIAAAVALAAVAMVYSRLGPLSPVATIEVPESIYTTEIGEQRSLSLDDGSIIHLNTLSTVQVRHGASERAIELVEGEALFDVAHDPDRPFRVYAGETIAEALGTTFNVHRIGSEAKVAVIEGKVTVTVASTVAPSTTIRSEPANAIPNAGSGTQITLSVGQTAEIDASGSIAASQSDNLEAVVAWRMRKLVFEDASLKEIADEFNRYNRTKIHIHGEITLSPRFSGVFDADDPDAFFSVLKASGTARINRVADDRIVLYLIPKG